MPAFTDDLVHLEFGPLDGPTRAGARDWVAARIGGAGEVTRGGLTVAGLLIGVLVRLRTGRAYADLPDDRRLAIARRLAGTSLPVLAEYVKAVRSLATHYVYEQRWT